MSNEPTVRDELASHSDQEHLGVELKAPNAKGDLEVIAVFPTREAAEQHVAYLQAVANGHEIVDPTESV